MGLLPTKKSIPRQYYNEFAKVRFGDSGEGKTSQAIQEENSILVQFEEGDKALSCYKVNLIEEARKKYGNEKKNGDFLWKYRVWEIFIDTVEEILKGEHPFKNIVIDSGDRAYDFRMLNFKFTEGRHPSDKVNGKSDFGSGWQLFNEGFVSPFYDLKESGYGIDVICHATSKTSENINGEEVTKIIPSVGGKMGEFFVDEFDLVIYHTRNPEGKRVLKVDSDGNFNAKQRLRFKVPIIDAGNNEEEAFENFKKAFKEAVEINNKKYGITQKDIKGFYNNKKEEQKLLDEIEEIKQLCQDKKLTLSQHNKYMEDKFGFSSMEDDQFDLDKAKEYKEFLSAM